jgi:glycosyltransferase involved in cell wall biosynthesis
MGLIRNHKRRFVNLEGLAAFDFTLGASRARPGVTAVVRVRTEEAKIDHCLRSIIPVFDEIVVVDNGSEDRTPAIVREVQAGHDPNAKIRLLSYPHRLARFGREHDRTPENSLHSAVYYTNWALSHGSFAYICKWDGDMVLARAAGEDFRAFLRAIQTGSRKCWVLAGQTVYRDLEGNFFLARGEINREVEIFPYGFRSRFVKSGNWERLRRPFYMRKGEFRPVCFFELKFTDEDEFSHWSNQDWPSKRKRREWTNFGLVRAGGTDGGNLDPDRFEALPRTFLDDQIVGLNRA